ncbi:MAG: hypothetical protein Q8K60_08670, partial [Parachlamydiaceae bacterium]|nr:hypothetical protein [Parachlamydiaceae bacterium]
MVQKVINQNNHLSEPSNSGEWSRKRKPNNDDSNGNFPDGKIKLLGPPDDHPKVPFIQIQKKEWH